MKYFLGFIGGIAALAGLSAVAGFFLKKGIAATTAKLKALADDDVPRWEGYAPDEPDADGSFRIKVRPKPRP